MIADTSSRGTQGGTPVPLGGRRLFLALVAVAAWIGASGQPARAERLTLDDCLREAVDHNPDIARTRHDVERATGTRLVYRARGMPNLSAGLLLGYQSKEQTEVLGPQPGLPQGSTNPRPARFFSLATSNSSQPIFDFGVPASWRRGNAEVTVALHNYAVTASSVLHSVRLQYVATVFLRDYGRTIQGIGSHLEKNVAITQERLKAGLVAKVNLDQSQIQVFSLSPGILSAQSGYRQGVIQLLNLMGRNLGAGRFDPSTVELDGELDTNAPPVTFDTAAAFDAGYHRPDVEALRAIIESLRDDKKVTRAGFYPLIRLIVNSTLIPQNAVQTGRPAIRPGDDTRRTEVDAGADMNWSVIDTGTYRGTVRTYQAIIEQFGVRLRQQEENLPGDLERVRAILEGTAARRRALNQGRDQSAAVLATVEQAVAQGTASQYDFLQAQNDLLNNRVSLLFAALDEANARAELDRLTGGYMRYVPDAAGKPTRAVPAAK